MIHSYSYCIEKIGDGGEVIETQGSLVRVGGLAGAVIGEGVSFESGEHGRVLTLKPDLAEVVVLSLHTLTIGTKAARTGSLLTISAGDGLLGRTINTLGHILSGDRLPSRDPQKRVIEVPPEGIAARRRVSRFFPTEVTAVDSLLTLGFGQRELVIGDRKTGKTQFLLQTAVSAAKRGTICIYTIIGKRKQEVKFIEEFLRTAGVMPQCIVIAADSYRSPAEIVYAPYTGMTLAEYFRDQGRDVLLVLDDLSSHAKAYREMSLLAGNFPGRESYPGDIFHVQSKLLERAGCFDIGGQEVTITCLPVAESVEGDITGYIQTNLMSMTDGHIYFDSNLFAAGRRPAINVFLSVTRVGRQTQTPLMRDITSGVMTALKKYQDAQRFTRFGPELTRDAKDAISRGEGLIKLFSQSGNSAVPATLQAILFALLWNRMYEHTLPSQIAAKVTPAGWKLLGRIVSRSQTFADLCREVDREKFKLMKFL